MVGREREKDEKEDRRMPSEQGKDGERGEQFNRGLITKILPAQDNSWFLSILVAALRFCRRIVGLKEEFYNRYIVRNDLLAPVVKAFLANGQKYNLLNSAIIEMFEFIKSVRELTVWHRIECIYQQDES